MTIPDDGDPARTKTALENEKLRLEIGALEQNAKPKPRNASTWVSLSVSVVTAIAAVTGIVMSNHNQQVADARAAQSAHNLSLQTALSLATDNVAGSARRLSGIYQLGQFWKEQQPSRETGPIQPITADQRSVGAALSALLLVSNEVEGASDVRCAAADIIGNAYENIVGDFQQPDDPKWVAMRTFLYGKSGVWGVVSRGNAFAAIRARPSTEDKPGSSQPVISAPVIAQAPAANAVSPIQKTITCSTTQDAMKEAIRKSWNDLRETDLQDNDLSYASLYEADLHAASLYHADLHGANLRCANLSNADLRNANLQGAYVELANIHEASTGTQVADLDRPARSIDIADEKWLEWKRGKFTLAKLKKIMQKSFPAWAEGERDFCQ